MSKLPRWLLITLISVGLGGIITGLVFMIRSSIVWVNWTGLILIMLLVALAIVLATYIVPQLRKAHQMKKFIENMPDPEATSRSLESLAQQGKAHEATLRFNQMMKDAPDNAYLYYMKAMFMRNVGNTVEAYEAAKSALSLTSDNDPSLSAMIQESASQPGMPSTVSEFRAQLKSIISDLEPKIKEINARKEKAVQKRKRKSR